MKALQSLLIFLNITFLLFASLYSNAQTETICGGEVPRGWVTLSIDGLCVNRNISRTIMNVANLPTGTELDVCGSEIPDGWVSISIQPTYCKTLAGTSYYGRRLKKIEDLPSGSEIYVCGSDTPPGWITLSIDPNVCRQFWEVFFIGKVIKKIDGLPSGTELDVCGGDVPPGWVSLSIQPSYCANVRGIEFGARRIKKVDGLPAGTELDVCGSDVPEGWVTISVEPTFCRVLGNVYYTGKRIKKVDCMPVGSVLHVCGDNTPNGWVILSVDPGYCVITGGIGFIGKTIKKISSYTTIPEILGSSDYSICPGQSINLTASNCPGGTFTWSNNSLGGSITVSPTISTSYFATCNQNGCTNNSNIININVITPSVPNSTGKTICLRQSTSLTATGCSGTYKWYNSTTSNIILVSTPTYTTPVLNSNTTFYVSCTVNNCESARKATLVTVGGSSSTIPNATGKTICSGRSTILNATNCVGTYKWYSSNTSTTVLVSTANYTTPALSINTTYYVSCTINNCESTRRATLVTVNQSPVAPNISTSSNYICSAQNVILTATGCNGTVKWQNGVTGNIISINIPGTYSATCNKNNCISLNSNIVIIYRGAPDNLNLSGNAANSVSYANKKITSSQIITTGTKTSYNAGGSVILSPPFNARTGSVFKAEIKGCSN